MSISTKWQWLRLPRRAGIVQSLNFLFGVHGGRAGESLAVSFNGNLAALDIDCDLFGAWRNIVGQISIDQDTRSVDDDLAIVAEAIRYGRYVA